MSAKHSGRSVVPQQRMLCFTSVANKAAAAYFNLKPSKVQDNSYTITLTPNNLQKQTGSQVIALQPALVCMYLQMSMGSELCRHDLRSMESVHHVPSSAITTDNFLPVISFCRLESVLNAVQCLHAPIHVHVTFGTTE